MKAEGNKMPKSSFTKMVSHLSFSNLYKRFVPDMRSGNQPDMPTTTNDRLWFLVENRFLFFTRGGPVEVTLKPSFVLAGILVCMAGVATIFYSTLIASYSAIEVIRDETIQTAQASISKNSNINSQSDIAKARGMTWHSYQVAVPQIKQPQSTTNKHSLSLNETATNPNDAKLPTSENNSISINKNADEMPMIINAGKRITLASKVNKSELESAPSRITSVKSPQSAPNVSTRNTQSIAAKNSKDRDVRAKIGKPIDVPSTTQQAVTNGEEKTFNSASGAQELAITLMPDFKSVLNPSQKSKQKDSKTSTSPFKTTSPNALSSSRLQDNKKKEMKNSQSFQNAKNDDASLDIAPSMDAPVTQNGPVLPIVTKAARTKKMLLSFRQEIEYIRSTLFKLGISQGSLPPSSLVKNRLNDDEFQSLMINLADHRAALRKIPFKPPMLYFYISSDYGKRKHPKTGRTTFHHGLDLAGTWQENVRVTAPGTVVSAGREGSFGKVVRVQHEFGVTTTYAHLARITVANGDYVSENHIIGKMGNTGKSAGAHLHYEIRVNKKSINPSHFMKIGRQISVAGELRQSALVK